MDVLAQKLDDFVVAEVLLPAVAGTFPTKYSLNWFVRQHRDELVTAGAAVIITGRWRFHPALFQRTVLDIARADALTPGRAQSPC